MQPQAVPISYLSISKVTYRNVLVLADLDIDIDYVQEIARVFSEPFNHEPHHSRLWNHTEFFTPLSCDLEPDISFPVSDFSIFKVTHQNVLVSADMGIDIDPV